MENIDTLELNEYDEEDMFLCDVCGEDHELLLLDSYLRDVFRGRRAHGGTAEIIPPGGEDTI
jgi:hypothetical protein